MAAIADLKVSNKGVFDFCKHFIGKEDVSCARVYDALVVVELIGEVERKEEGGRREVGGGRGRREEGEGGGRREKEEGGGRREEGEGGGRREEGGGRREEGEGGGRGRREEGGG